MYAGNGNFTGGGSAQYGCGTFNVSSNANWAALRAQQKQVVLFIDRNPVANSGCYFTQKVYNAQVSQGLVVAVIVGDTQSDTLVYMKDDDSGSIVTIPSMFVGVTTRNLLAQYWNVADVIVEMESALIQPAGLQMDASCHSSH